MVRRAREDVRRASTRRTRPRRRARARPRRCPRARTLGIFGTSANGESARSSGRKQRAEPLDLVVGEARADVARPAQLARVLDAERRARRTLRRGVPARACSRRSTNSCVWRELHLQPVAASAGRAGTRAGPLGDDALELLSRARPRGAPRRRRTCGETSTAGAPASTSCSRRSRRSASGSVDDRLAVDLEDVEERTRTSVPPPCCMSEKLERPSSSSAQTSPSSTQSGERIARLAAPARRRESGSVRSLPLRLVSVASPPATVAIARIAVPLRPRRASRRRRERVGERGEHRLRSRRVRAAPCSSSCGGAASSSRRRRGSPARASRRPRAARRRSRTVRPPSRFSSTSSYVPAIPDLDRAGAVLPGGDLALERRVVERVVLDVDGEVPLAGLERDALRHGPARERAVALEPEVVVEASRVVALDDEDRASAPVVAARRTAPASSRVALAPILVEAHLPDLVARTRQRVLRPTGVQDAAFDLLADHAIHGTGDKPVEVWKTCRSTAQRRRPSRGTSRAAGGGARRARSASSSSSAAQSALLEEPRGRVVVVVRPARRLRDDPVDTPSSRQCAASGLNAAAAFLRLARVAPEDRGAALGRDDRVDRVLLHQHAVGDGDRDRAARAALADDARDGRHAQAQPSRPASGRSRRPARAARRRRPGRRPACRRA